MGRFLNSRHCTEAFFPVILLRNPRGREAFHPLCPDEETEASQEDIEAVRGEAQVWTKCRALSAQGLLIHTSLPLETWCIAATKSTGPWSVTFFTNSCFINNIQV